MLIDPHTNKPISSKRKTVLQVHLVDQQAMSSQPQTFALGFELDQPDRTVIAQLLANISRTIIGKLDEIHFFAQPEAPQAPPS